MITMTKTLIGVPYKDFGRSFDGCDCYGIVWLYHAEVFKSILPTYTNCYKTIEPVPETMAFIHKAARAWCQVEWSEIKVGDVFALRVNQHINHCGVYVGDNNFLHIMRGRNSSLERLNTSVWRGAVKGIYRWAS